MENLFNPFSYNVRLLKKLVAILALPFILKASKSPNFVLVYMDDLGWAETSVEMIKGREDTRSDFNRTPNVERLAREGMVLSACY